MHVKKVALYVEGQTEQILIKRLIGLWWNFSGINIENIKIYASENERSSVLSYCYEQNPDILFLIVDVGGEGSLPSAIANRAKKHHEQGFKIIALRDLYANDFESYPENTDRVSMVMTNFKTALTIKRCHNIEDINLFFAVMEIEAWLLAFPKAISAGLKINEQLVLNKLTSVVGVEEIRRPSVFLGEIVKMAKRSNPKSLGTITLISDGIERDELESIYYSNKVPSFTKFWKYLLQLSGYAS